MRTERPIQSLKWSLKCVRTNFRPLLHPGSFILAVICGKLISQMFFRFEPSTFFLSKFIGIRNPLIKQITLNFENLHDEALSLGPIPQEFC